MAGYDVAKIDEIESSHGGAFKQVRTAVGGTAFGINIMDLPANADGYPEHDHAHDGQEEIYVTLSGGGVMQVDGDEVTLDANTIIRVAAGAKRKVLPGDAGARLLVVGGTPGKAYEPN